MAFKAKSQQREPISQIRAADMKWEVRPDGSVYWTYTPPPLEITRKYAKWRPIWCAGFDLDEQGVRHYHHIECIQCHCPPGPQWRAIESSAFEVLLIGGRGSAKSEATFGAIVKGNIPFSNPTNPLPADISYVNSPNYSFLVLRKNAKDLKNYKKRAARFFASIGGDMTEDEVKFPSGAFGIFDHLADNDAWEKYQGQEFTRIIVEEVNQIGELENYLKVLMSCRSSDMGLREQVIMTANPGGRGHKWVAERFYKLRKANGARLRNQEVYRDPAVEDTHKQTRVYIRSTVDDNPYLLAKGYDKQLDLLKTKRPSLWKRWRLGDMEIGDSQFFEEFRKEVIKDAAGKPLEAPNAVHVIRKRPLLAHWPRAIGGDWGYSHKSAIGWGCWTPQKQLEVYRELVVSKVGTMDLGTRIAEASMEDLKGLPGHHMTMYLSPDAFGRKDEGLSQAEQIASGISMVLGENAAFVLDTTEEEELLEDKVAWSSVYSRQRALLNKTHITIVRAQNARKAGWDLIHNYLRWWSLVPEGQRFNEDVARRILHTEGAREWLRYKEECEDRDQEVLPILQIHSCCTEIIEGIIAAETDENDTEDVLKQDDDDEIDMIRYLCTGFTYQEAVMPKEMHVAEKLRIMKEQMPGLSAGSLIMAARKAEQDYGNKTLRGLNIPRFAARRQQMAKQFSGRVN